jgi:O-antigen/teichoic acid export membrane protein
MNGIALRLVTFAGVPVEMRARAATNLTLAISRYTLSAVGPIGVSAAHFLAALILLRVLPRAEFGLFSFLLVLSPFCLSLCGAMFAPPIAHRSACSAPEAVAEERTLFKASLVFSAVAASVIGPVVWFSGAAVWVAASFGLYSGTMSLRWFARCWAYGLAQTVRVLISDIAYSTVLSVTLLSLLAIHRLTLGSVGLALLLAATAGLIVFGASQSRQYWAGARCGELRAFVRYWRAMSGWAVLGVVLSELTANAHAYIVTLVSGPHAFAVLAVGSLLMRPVSLVLAALPDMERPLMSRAMRSGEIARALQIVKEFRTAGGAIWVVTIAIGAVLLTWFPHFLVKKDYPFGDVCFAVVLSAAIMALRALRTPISVLLQAAGEFRRLTVPGLWSGAISLISTFVLLIIAGPIAAFIGILLGEAVATERTFALVRVWKRGHD